MSLVLMKADGSGARLALPALTPAERDKQCLAVRLEDFRWPTCP